MPAAGHKKKKTLNTFMLKSIVDDTNGGLFMLGTFVQRVFDLDDDDMKDEFHFKYRFNEMEPDQQHLQRRRTQPLQVKWKDENEKSVKGTRSTFQAKIPLAIDTLHSIFPFQINVATAKIELSSDAKYRPNLLVDKGNRRTAISIQTLADKDDMIREGIGLPESKFERMTRRFLRKFHGGEDNYEKRRKLDRVLDKIDRSKNFDFLSPHPIVRFQYDQDKGYCPTFTLSFYIITKGFDRWVQLVLPILLVTVVATMNSVNDHTTDDNKGVDATEHFQITSALTLAVVFILPQALDSRNRKSQLLTAQDAFVIIFFVALLLSTLPKGMVKTAGPELLGVTVMLSCVIFALRNTVKYIGIQTKVYNEALKQHLNDKHRYLNDEIKNSPYTNLKTIDEFDVGGDWDDSLYRLRVGERYRYLNWALMTPDPHPALATTLMKSNHFDCC